MLIDFEAIPEIILLAMTFFAVYYAMYRKYIYSILDPLFIYVFTISFSSVLVYYTLEENKAFMIHFYVCNLFLYLGFWLCAKYYSKDKSSINKIDQKIFFDYKILGLTVYMLFFLYLLANLLLFYTTGFPFLSDEPTVAKVENFSKGYGIILKINWGVGSFVMSSLLFMMLYKFRFVEFTMFLIAVLFTGLEGSKSAY